MTAIVSATMPRRRSLAVRILGALGLAVLCAAAGAAMVAGAVGRFGDAAPAVLLSVALVPLLAAAILGDPRLGVIAVFASFPVGTVSVPTGLPFFVTTLQLVEVAVIVVAVLVALRRLGAGEMPLRWSPALWWALGLFCWTLVALPSAASQDLAVRQIAALGGAIIFACVVVAACLDMDDVRRVAGGLVAVAAIVGVRAIASAGEFRAIHSATTVMGRAQGTFDQPNQLGSFAALSALVAIGLLFGARSRRGRVAAGLGLAVILPGLVLSLSRGAWVGSILAVGFLLVSLREARRAVLALSIPLFVLGAVAGAFAPTNPQIAVVGERFQSFTELSAYDSRPAIYAEARREILADPWTGEGPGSFPVASVRAASASSTVSADHAHNMLLTWGAEDGLPAVALILAFAVALGFAGRSAALAATARGDRRDRAMIAGLQAGLIAIFGQGLVDYTLRNSVILVAVWGVIGLLLAAQRARVPGPPPASEPPAVAGLPVEAAAP